MQPHVYSRLRLLAAGGLHAQALFNRQHAAPLGLFLGRTCLSYLAAAHGGR